MQAMSTPFIMITSDYGWIGRFAWHNSADWDFRPAFNPFRIWGMTAWMQSLGPRGHEDQRAAMRRKLLAIAAELEGADG